MGLIAGLQLLLQGQAFVLLGLLSGSCRKVQLIQVVIVLPGLIRQLSAKAPILDLPGDARAGGDQQAGQHQGAGQFL